jgi:signal transduction histidine kinase/ActR/RegA family two-component response regulator
MSLGGDDRTGAQHAAVLNRQQFPIRLSLGLATALLIAVTTAWPLTPLWAAAFTIALTFLDYAQQAEREGRSVNAAQRRASLATLALTSTLFVCITPFLWLHAGASGPVCALILLAGGSLNVLATNHAHRPSALAGLIPYIAAFALLPVLSFFGDHALAFSGVVAVGVGVYLLHGYLLWRVWNATVRSERAARLELEQRRAEAEAATAAKSAFVAMVSHELRTPISGVLAAAAELQRATDDPRHAECAAIVVESGRFMHTLLNDLLDLAKIEAGRMTVEDVVFDLGLFAHEIGRFWALEAHKRGVPLRLESAFGLPGRVVGDPTRLRQVLNNLLSNALKFTGPEGVTWSIDVGMLGSGQAELTVRVTDSGTGLSPERLDRLFTPYDQTEVTVARTHGGTGLGLSISRELARLMGGDLTAESPPGQGATFVLQVRLGAAASVPAPAAAPVSEPAPKLPVRPLRVLAVDDHEINRRTVGLLLQPLGAEVVTAVDGADALERANAEAFDLILMDVLMPVMNGRDATRRLRAAAGPNRDTPVLGVTGGDTAEDFAACHDAGMSGCVAKPLSPQALYEAIERCLSPNARAEPESLSA